MPDASSPTLGKVLSGAFYRVPPYQRGYAWTDLEVNDFLDDIEHTTRRWYEDGEQTAHKLGTIQITERIEGYDETYDVIDGQQRICTSALVMSELVRTARQLGTLDVTDPTLNRRIRRLNECADSMERKFMFSDGNPRFLPAEHHEATYRALLNREDPNPSTPSEQRMVTTVETVRSRIDDWLDQFGGWADCYGADIAPTPDAVEFLQYIVDTLDGRFEVNRDVFDSRAEAGRQFEVRNGRGKDLHEADFIKSYLIYYISTHGEVALDVEDVDEQFVQIREQLGHAFDIGSFESHLSHLIRTHWTLFSCHWNVLDEEDFVGRRRSAGSIAEEIKHVSYHLPRDPNRSLGVAERAESWITTYLHTLQRATDAYIRIHDPTTFLSTVNPALKESLFAVEEFGPSSTRAVRMALYLSFIDADDNEFDAPRRITDEATFTPVAEQAFTQVMQAFETYIMRVVQVGGANRDKGRTSFRKEAFALFWRWAGNLDAVSGADSALAQYAATSDIPALELGCTTLATYYEQALLTRAREYTLTTSGDLFEQRLADVDVERGQGVAGWSGVKDGRVLSYILYEYEKSLRNGELSERSYLDLAGTERTVEHVWPRTQPASIEFDAERYSILTGHLGNLTLLTREDNSGLSNLSYQEKWDKTYGDSTMRMIREDFPNPRTEGSWGPTTITARSARIAAFAADHWGVDAAASDSRGEPATGTAYGDD